ncbi:uncharacterized protein [Palaemon carinicauda]|uniref:uncharacterized protein n=1 Tax=Palaemon carinicauda TaxID=392227 RepID=UPI0035B6484F
MINSPVTVKRPKSSTPPGTFPVPALWPLKSPSSPALPSVLSTSPAPVPILASTTIPMGLSGAKKRRGKAKNFPSNSPVLPSQDLPAAASALPTAAALDMDIGSPTDASSLDRTETYLPDCNCI